MKGVISHEAGKFKGKGEISILKYESLRPSVVNSYVFFK